VPDGSGSRRGSAELRTRSVGKRIRSKAGGGGDAGGKARRGVSGPDKKKCILC